MLMPEESDASQPSPVIKATYFSVQDNLLDDVIDQTHPVSARRVWLTCRYLHFRRPRNVPQG
jgi:hypothetical protein